MEALLRLGCRPACRFRRHDADDNCGPAGAAFLGPELLQALPGVVLSTTIVRHAPEAMSSGRATAAGWAFSGTAIIPRGCRRRCWRTSGSTNWSTRWLRANRRGRLAAFQQGARRRPAGGLAAPETATNPAVLDAFALAIIATGESGRRFRELPATSRTWPPLVEVPPRSTGQWTNSQVVRRARLLCLRKQLLRAELAATHSGARTMRSFAATKEKYDPHGLFCVHHGVGSEEWSDDGFTRVR